MSTEKPARTVSICLTYSSFCEGEPVSTKTDGQLVVEEAQLHYMAMQLQI